MNNFPKLTFKRILKKHNKNPQNKALHKMIETRQIEKDNFNKLIQEGTKHKPFDKKK